MRTWCGYQCHPLINHSLSSMNHYSCHGMWPHRRFREFAELNSQVKQNMKGHHLRDVLPPLPEKTSKHFFDHKDLNFIQERTFKLETFLCNMVSIPHVANMICMKAFLGIMDKVRRLWY